MRKLFNVIVLALAVNFLAVAGLVGWLVQSKHLDKSRVAAIKDVLFPKDMPPPTSQPAADPTTQPLYNLEQLLTQQSGRSAAEQVEFIQQKFDAQMAQLDRRERELNDLQKQVELSKQQIVRDRGAFSAQKTALDAREQESKKLLADKGFQDSLSRYNVMPAKQVKQIFLTLDDATVKNYLQAMEPRAAGRIIKEFKSPDEVSRIQKVLELMRQTPPPAVPQPVQSPQSSQASAKE